LLRQGMSSVIQSEKDLSLVGEASDGREAVELFLHHRPDLTLMDLRMPKMDGVEATAAIRAQCSDARIVMLTTFEGDAQALRALKAGASGYLLKSMIRTSLLDAIHTVMAGHRFIHIEIAAELAAHVTDDTLSVRELEVLNCVAAGNSNRRVAAKLTLSEDTVKTHMKSIMSKLKANDRTHAVAIAAKRGIIEL
jgi:DNA-binding NarL/FixJ family response regulator